MMLVPKNLHDKVVRRGGVARHKHLTVKRSMSSWPPMARRGPAISEVAVSALEAHLRMSVPGDYRDFLPPREWRKTERSHRMFRMKNDCTNLNSLYSIHGTPPGFDLQAE
jgi:hypothetical protein